MSLSELDGVLENIMSYSDTQEIIDNITAILLEDSFDKPRWDVARAVFWDHGSILDAIYISEYKPKTERTFAILCENNFNTGLLEVAAHLYELHASRCDAFVDVTKTIFGDHFPILESTLFSEMKSLHKDSIKNNPDWITQDDLFNEEYELKLSEFENSRYLPNVKSVFISIKDELNLKIDMDSIKS